MINKLSNYDRNLKVVRLNKELPLPKYQSELSSGMDLYASIDEPVIIKSGKRYLVPTGIKVQLPLGYEMQIRPRSGLALRYGISILNTPGTIDAKII